MRDHRSPGLTDGFNGEQSGRAPGKRTLTENFAVQRRAAPEVAEEMEEPQEDEEEVEEEEVADDLPDESLEEDEAPEIRQLMDDALRPDLAEGVVQRIASAAGTVPSPDVHAAAEHGLGGSAGSLPFLDTIQPLFGQHDVSGVASHQDSQAREGARRMGAEAFSAGERIGFGDTPSLHTAAHEAAHVVQQRAGVHLKGGVGEVGDRYEQHADAVADRVVRGESAATLLDELAGPGRAAAPTAAAAAPVQRIVRINNGNILPQQHVAFIDFCRGEAEGAGLIWTDAMSDAVRGWLDDMNNVIAAPDGTAVAFNAYHHTADPPGQWERGMTRTAIPADVMAEARRLRHVDRFASLMKPHDTQTPATVPGLGMLDDRDLLPLAERGQPEQQFWMRPSTSDPKKVMNVKRRDISATDEAHITASGVPTDPSYTVHLNNRQLSHRYRGTNQKFIKGGKHARTYGSKKAREGYDYKGSGLVDGHSVQVQDDQPILGPYQSQASSWSTTTPQDGGTSQTFSDTGYLPTGPTDERFIEEHPHNFYWENQEQGKHMRQKAIETPAMKNQTSFLHYNDYSSGYEFHPNAGKAQKNRYPIPGRIDYETVDTSGGRTHYNVDNRPEADYSQPKKYDATTHRYPTVPGGKASASQNRTLGGVSAFDHLELAKEPVNKFPRSTVLKPGDKGFEFQPPWRGSVPGHKSPPRSPYWGDDGLESDTVTQSGDQTSKQHFHEGGRLVTGASYDKAKDSTDLTRKTPRSSEPTSWTGGQPLSKSVPMDVSKAPPKPTSAPTKTSTSTEQLQQHQRLYDTIHQALGELNAAVPMAIPPVLRAQLVTPLVHTLGQLFGVNRNDATQTPQLHNVYNTAVQVMQAIQPVLQRRQVGGGMGEAANAPRGARGRRWPALRQFFNECGQMAALNVLAFSGVADGEAALNALGNLDQDIDEDDIRTMLNAAGRPDLPVVSNLAQLVTLVGLLQANNVGQLDALNIGVVERQGLQAVSNFNNRNTAVLNLVVNTTGYKKGLQSGSHWIAVRLAWRPNGELEVDYRDSLDADSDYTGLFASLRVLFNAVPVNAVGGGHGNGGDASTGKNVKMAT